MLLHKRRAGIETIKHNKYQLVYHQARKPWNLRVSSAPEAYLWVLNLETPDPIYRLHRDLESVTAIEKEILQGTVVNLTARIEHGQLLSWQLLGQGHTKGGIQAPEY